MARREPVHSRRYFRPVRGPLQMFHRPAGRVGQVIPDMGHRFWPVVSQGPHRLVVSNCEEPRRYPALGAEQPCLLPDGQPKVLFHLLGQMRIAYPPGDVAAESDAVTLLEQGQRPSVAFRHALQQNPVLHRHPDFPPVSFVACQDSWLQNVVKL